jgi:hypothetical protein
MPGVVMAADSAITKIDGQGRIREIDQQGWLKVLKVPKVQAAVGYWGFIGRIHSGRFDDWLNRSIEQTTYSDLPSLAASVAGILNKALHNKPLANNECAGVHIAGFHAWDDGERRPFLFHVHNGHGHVDIEYVTEALPQGARLMAVRTRPVTDPRTLFEAHQDFPLRNIPLEQNLALLKQGYTTRNGDFFITLSFGEHFNNPLTTLTSFPIFLSLVMALWEPVAAY